MFKAITAVFAPFVGPKKSGTAWANASIALRGDVAMQTETKETFFFDKPYQRGFAWYDILFPPESDSRFRADVVTWLFHKA